MSKQRLFVAIAAMMLLNAPLLGDEVVLDQSLTWLDLPVPQRPAGAKFAMIEGDFAKPGAIRFRFYLPAHYDFPAHYHDTDEEVTVVSGQLNLRMGHSSHPESERLLGVGAVERMAAGVVHSVVTTDDAALVEVRTSGPYKIYWVQ
jgi:quercetin dioxygenase-like cupin family protein